MGQPTRRQSGFVLIASILLLLVLSILGVSMFRGAGLQEKVAGSVKEKARALQMAQVALHHAESLIDQSVTSPLPQSSNCAAALTVATVCTNAVSIKNAPLAALTNGYTDTSAPGLNASDVSSSGGKGTYYAYPQFYIQYLGLSSNGQGQVYEITALGFGGNANAVSIIKSTFELSSGVVDLGAL